MRAGRSMGMRNRGRWASGPRPASGFSAGSPRFGRWVPFSGNQNFDSEKQFLKEEADQLSRQLKDIQDRLADLETPSSTGS